MFKAYIDSRGYTLFFIGEVELIKNGLFNTRYRIIRNGAIISVKTGRHIRLVENQFNFGPIFPIMAHMQSVKIIYGVVPEELIEYRSGQDYLLAHQRYIQKLI